MGLPSQTGRVGSRGKRRSRTVARRKRRLSPPVAFVLLVVLGGGGWLAISSLGGPRGASASESASDEQASIPPVERENGQTDLSQRMPSMTELANRMDDEAAIEPLPDPVTRPNTVTTPPAEQTRTPITAPAQNTPAPERRLAETSSFGDLELAALFDEADALIRANDPVAARRVLNRPLVRERLDAAQAAAVRDRIASLNADLIFSPRVNPKDPFTETYQVRPSDSLAKIAANRELAVDWRFIQRVNGINDPRRIRVGQNLKLVRGPFHVRVDKSDYRADLFAGPPEVPEEWTYIRSFEVGLGESDSTPIGLFRVKRDSKLINPHWVNPRTGEQFSADDPENPIGERWIGIAGVGADAVYEGYGLHGTIDADSIGGQESMGCVRMDDESIAIVYEALVEELSVVRITG